MKWVGGLAVALAACGTEKPPVPAAAESVPVPATVALADFKHLGYLHGDWRGTMANGKAFYERYVVTDDSTIASFTVQDSTFNVVSDSGFIRWSNGQVRTGSEGSSYVATIWTPDSVRFDPERKANNAFVWIRVSADQWTARLLPRSGAEVVYPMERLKQPFGKSRVD